MFILVCLLVVSAVNVMSQTKRSLSSSIPKSSKKEDTKKEVKVWNIDARYGVADTIEMDTAITSYQDNTPVNRYSIANAWTGNLGSPLESKIYFDRTKLSMNMFSRAFDAYTILPSNVSLYNTKTPISNLTYRTALKSYMEEDYLKVMLTMNANKYVNVGGLCNFIYGRGQYNNQSTNMLNGGFWTSYTGKRYECIGVVMFNDYKLRENGGVADMDYILNPEQYGGVEPENIPVAMTNAQTFYRNYSYFFNHRYSLGINRERKLENDSVVVDFVPVTSFIHTIDFQDIRRKYVERNGANTGFYDNTYISDAYTKDSLSHFSLKNTLAVTLDEKFNTLLKFGLAAFVEYDLFRYATGFDSVLNSDEYYHDLKVGAILSKNEGKWVKYNVKGEVYVLGPHVGEFSVSGDIDTDFKIGKKDRMEISASVALNHSSSYMLYNKYVSNHFQWENDFERNWQLRVGGRIGFPQRGISIGFNMENNKNFVYLNQKALPEQHLSSVTVIGVDLKADLKLWKFHLDNQFVYQYTNAPEVLRLPDFSMYSNLYFKDKFFGVLTTQIGVSCRFHTAYYGNKWMPALGQYYLQDEMKVGNYPELNVYLNFHLKTVRFYAQYFHWNKGLFNGMNNYFLMPNYPANPGTFQLGLSWNFWG